jgi:hypothetical protein
MIQVKVPRANAPFEVGRKEAAERPRASILDSLATPSIAGAADHCHDEIAFQTNILALNAAVEVANASREQT